MHHEFAQRLRRHFLSTQKTAEDASVCNIAMFQLLSSPYFRQNHTDFSLRQTSWGVDLFFKDKSYQMLDHIKSFESKVPPSFIFWEDITPKWRALSETVLDKVFTKEKQMLFSPSPLDFAKKDTLEISRLTNESLHEKCQAILGPVYDVDLKETGIKYHEPRWSWRETQWVYFLAHNDKEIAGVLGGYKEENCFILSYLSVSPQFRKQGLSYRLYERVIAECMENEDILVRSNASDFTKENGITTKYNILLSQHPIVHCVTNTYTQDALQVARATASYAELVPFSSALTSLTDSKIDLAHAEKIKKAFPPPLPKTFKI